MQKNTSNSGYSYIKQESVEFPTIDLANPYQLQAGVKFELSKMDDMSGNAYMIALDKALKNIAKNKDAYRDLQFANFNEVKKEDEKLQMTEVGKKQSDKVKTDSAGHLKKALVQNEKANVSAKKENKKGKPKGVKEMSNKPKKASGVEMMEMPGKEQVLNELKSFLQKKSKLSEDMHYKYTLGQEVLTPKGVGQVCEIVGGTITVKLGDDSMEDFQVNILDKQHDVQHDQTPIDLPEPKEETPSSAKDEMMEKIKDYLSKSNNKQEAVKALKEYFSKKKKKNEAFVIKTKRTGRTVDAGKNLSQGVSSAKSMKDKTGEPMVVTDLATGKETNI